MMLVMMVKPVLPVVRSAHLRVIVSTRGRLAMLAWSRRSRWAQWERERKLTWAPWGILPWLGSVQTAVSLDFGEYMDLFDRCLLCALALS